MKKLAIGWFVLSLETIIVCIAQNILIGYYRVDWSLAVLSVIQLAHSSSSTAMYLEKKGFEFDHIGHLEIALAFTNLLSYSLAAFAVHFFFYQ